MKSLITILLLALLIPGMLMTFTGCAPPPPPADGGGTDGGGDTDGGGGVATLNIVKTNIDLHSAAKLRCGNDLIAFGTGTTTGVSYVVPSLNPTAGTPVPDSALYNSKGFAVAGKNIFLAGAVTGALAYQVSVCDTTTGTITATFPTTDIRLKIIPGGQSDQGHIQADGN